MEERALFQAQSNPVLWRLLLAPWHAFTFPCATVGCRAGEVHLPAPSEWHISSRVRTLSYGADEIVYSVKVAKPTLMVENELAIAGWRSDTNRVQSVDSGTPLRAWRLAPGDYEFAASFREPGRSLQDLLAILAVVAWLGSVGAIRCRRSSWASPDGDRAPRASGAGQRSAGSPSLVGDAEGR
jgi:hypothetical protein